MSDNLSRTLTLLEHLSAARGAGLSVAQLVERTGLASSTVYRLTHDLEQLGYLRKTDDRRLVAKFLFEQGVVIGGLDLARIVEACQGVCAALRVASEFIVLRRESLFWHVAEDHPQQSIRLRAGVGFIRGAYELDSLTRMALAHLPGDAVESGWDISGFYDVGVSGTRMPWSAARARIDAVERDDMQFDLMGNAKGVRRYCVAITGADGTFAGLLTAAEAATPLRDEAQHVARVRAVLMDAKAALARGEPHPDARRNEA